MIEWSNRGPGANGRNGVDVVADGSYAPGDATLNTIIDGRNAWVTWGGTSRSTPVAVGAAALVYQAYKAKHGAFPTEPTVKAILKSSANDLGYDNFIQGSGSIDAGKAVAAATDARRRRHTGRVAAEHRHDGDEGPPADDDPSGRVGDPDVQHRRPWQLDGLRPDAPAVRHPTRRRPIRG